MDEVEPKPKRRIKRRLQDVSQRLGQLSDGSPIDEPKPKRRIKRRLRDVSQRLGQLNDGRPIDIDTTIKTRQFGIRDILGESWHLYRTNFPKILLVVLCVSIPTNILLFYLLPSGRSPNDILGSLYSSIIQEIVFLIGTISTIAIAYLVEKTIQEQSVTWGESLGYALSRWGSAIGTGLLAEIIIWGLAFLLIIPGIIWSVFYTFWVYVVALRHIGGKTALDYSKNLVVGQWWRVFGILLVIRILNILLYVVGRWVIARLFILVPDNQILSVAFNTITDIVAALFTVMMIVFFLNTDYLKNPSRAEQSIPPIDGQQVPALRHSGFGIASFFVSLLGGLSLVFWVDEESLPISFYLLCFGLPALAAFIGIPLGIAGVLQKDRKKDFAILGLVLNVLVIVFNIVLLVLWSLGDGSLDWL